MDLSFLEFIGCTERSTCGYCKNREDRRNDAKSTKEGETSEEGAEEEPETNFTTGSAVGHKLLAADYGELLDVGWRRSGRYLYKPDNRTTCCPQYTIRLDVTNFTMSRSQKRVMRQMNEFLATGKRPVCGVKEELAEDVQKTSTSSESKKEVVEKKERDADRPVLKKKEIRRARFEEKCRLRNINPEEIREQRRQKEESRRRTIQSYLDEVRPDWKHKLVVKLVGIESNEFKTRHDESFELYKKYQRIVHNDEARLAGFRRFLCDSPLKRETRNGVDIGSYHMWFLLDEKLIAVCVVDVLPKCLSAKYMFYDPDYSFLSIGTYTALREIHQTQLLERVCPTLKYYYMGYYIHSCPKMRYKAKFRPSDLLCDESFHWLDYEHCKELLDGSTEPNGFAVFRPDCARAPPINPEQLLVISKGVVLPFGRALERAPEAAGNEELRESVRRLTKLMGPELASVAFWFQELNE